MSRSQRLLRASAIGHGVVQRGNRIRARQQLGHTTGVQRNLQQQRQFGPGPGFQAGQIELSRLRWQEISTGRHQFHWSARVWPSHQSGTPARYRGVVRSVVTARSGTMLPATRATPSSPGQRRFTGSTGAWWARKVTGTGPWWQSTAGGGIGSPSCDTLRR